MSWREDVRNPASGAVKRKRGPMVQDRRAGHHQVTAGQILQEAFELNAHVESKKRPEVLITDPEELALYQGKLRKDLELKVQRGGSVQLNPWLTYARFEEQQKEVSAARSVFERAIDHHGTNPLLWKAYADLEIRGKNLKGVRAVLHRAVTSLPTCEELWLKFILIERAAQNVAGARDLFSRWLSITGPAHGWKLAIRFELDTLSLDRARELLGKFAVDHNTPDTWLFYAACETEAPLSNPDRAISVLETALRALKEPFADGRVCTALAELLIFRKQIDAARTVLLEALAKCSALDVRAIVLPSYSAFERQFGDKSTIESVLLNAKMAELEAAISLGDQEPLTTEEDSMPGAISPDANHEGFTIPKKRCAETWARYIAITEYLGDVEQTSRLYERSMLSGCEPLTSPDWRLTEQQRAWAPFVELWCDFAVFTINQFGNYAKAAETYRAILAKVPKGLSFSHVWTSLASIELWQKRSLTGFRKVMGAAVGSGPTRELFRFYIDAEQRIGQVLSDEEAGGQEEADSHRFFHGDAAAASTAVAMPTSQRIRKLYASLLSHYGHEASVWVEYSKFELKHAQQSTGGGSAAEQVLEAGINSDSVDDLLDKERLQRELIGLKIRRSDVDGARKVYHSLVLEHYTNLLDLDAPGGFAENRDLHTKFRQIVDALVSFELSYGGGIGGEKKEKKTKAVVKMRDFFTSLATTLRNMKGAPPNPKPFLDAWRRFEQKYGNDETLRMVEDTAEAPKKKKRRLLDKAKESAE